MAPKVLIVDDDPDLVEMLQVILTGAGYTTLTAFTGTEALRTARKSTPDLVILDLLLPELNGFIVCEQLRQHRATSSVPIIMITGVPGEFPRLAGIEVGADAYVRKPFEVQEMVSRVAGLLHQSQAFPSASWRRDNWAELACESRDHTPILNVVASGHRLGAGSRSMPR
jgi:DNA-binding response OmpR family regulator